MKLRWLSLIPAATCFYGVQDVECFSIGRSFLGRRHCGVLLRSSPSDTRNSILKQTDCDDGNTPPSMAVIINSIRDLQSGSDIRGQYVSHLPVGSILNIAHSITSREAGSPPALTPFAAYCLGHAFAKMVVKQIPTDKDEVTICLGTDPREHGMRLADAFSRGAESVEGTKVIFTGLASTPAMFEFCRSSLCDAGVMVTASHLPEDRNGFKMFTKNGGFSKKDIQTMTDLAILEARGLHDTGIIPPSSGPAAVMCSERVHFMKHYIQTLQDAIIRESSVEDDSSLPLAGLRIVLNAGNGSGSFFNNLLQKLGADVSSSFNLNPDGTFPDGVPNPENNKMIEKTLRACEECKADIGIMFDTDADRCGFVVPRTVTPTSSSDYEALNKNRLIALLSVIFSNTSPGSTIVTDSTTSEGLSDFITNNLGLVHNRYLRGYANVIGKAKEITESGEAIAEMAIETSGHCAMRENGYLDDGTYTAVKVIGLLSRISRSSNADDRVSLLDLISDMKEMEVEKEVRLNVLDGSIQTTTQVFGHIANIVEDACTGGNGSEKVTEWELDSENLEGVRVRTGNGGFFMLRRSLHDPVISIMVEGTSPHDVQTFFERLYNLLQRNKEITGAVELSVLQN
uniref:Phosphomannomutase n=4 Tax=Ditylum brightwellii TaxID=49249 RepID=A0A6S8ZXF6_9STRA|mmetsp:Transcript_19567/g.28331  ORF Transcript_19567/g.28331 Transcript_19567/m.28331 type:complete len:626 (+) Transcript_19567:117-1994(+)